MAKSRELLIVKQTAGKCAVELFKNTVVNAENLDEVLALVKKATNAIFVDFQDVPEETASSSNSYYKSDNKPSYEKKSYAPRNASDKQLKFVKDLLDKKTDIDINRKNEITGIIQGGNVSAKDASQLIDELQ